MLPEGFPKWRAVHSHCNIWSEPREGPSQLSQALKNQFGAAREKQGRNACSSFLVIDAHSVKSVDTAGLKDDDVGRLALGIKRHILVDTQGLPHAVTVTTAEVTDRQGELQAFERCKPRASGKSKACCATAATWERLSPRQCARRWMSQWACKLPRGASCTHSRSCLTAGWSSAALPGWRRTEGCVRTVSAGSISVCSSFT